MMYTLVHSTIRYVDSTFTCHKMADTIKRNKWIYNLLEANIISILPKTLSAHVQSILADQAVTI